MIVSMNERVDTQVNPFNPVSIKTEVDFEWILCHQHINGYILKSS